MNGKWRLVLSLGKLPGEFDDVERISRYFVLAGLAIFGFAFLPGQHYLAYVACVGGALLLGRVVGIALHDRVSLKSQLRILRPLGMAGRIFFIAAVAIVLAVTLYWAWTTGERVFFSESLVAAATLTFVLANGHSRIALGIADVGLSALALVFGLIYHDFSFLLPAAYAAFMAWALLLKGRNRSSGKAVGSTTLTSSNP